MITAANNPANWIDRPMATPTPSWPTISDTRSLTTNPTMAYSATSAPMTVALTYTITGLGTDTVNIPVGASLTETVALPGGANGNEDGQAQASSGTQSDLKTWVDCDPPTSDPPSPPPEE